MRITKSNSLIEARYHLKLSEQRIILSSISVIEPKSDTFPETVTITALDLVRIYGIDDSAAYKSLAEMDNFLDSGRNSLTIKDTKEVSHKSVWVSSSKYYKKEGKLILAFSPDVKRYLQGLKQQFTTYNLRCIAQLKSTYSIRLYELMVQFNKTGRRSITLQELREILKIPDEQYKVFGDLKKRVILPSVKELKEKSKLDIVTIKYEKKGRSVHALHFFFEETEKL